MKVLHIISGLRSGGAEGVLTRLCGSTDFESVVISLTSGGVHEETLSSLGIEYYCLNFESQRGFLKNFIKLVKRIKGLNPDIVQTWMYHGDLLGGVAALMAGNFNVVWNVRHSDLPAQHASYMIRAVRKVSAWLSYIVPRQIIYCSHEAAQNHKTSFYNNRLGVVIENGFNFDGTPTPAARSAKSFKTPTLLMVARFNHQKNHRLLLQALSKLEKFGVVFNLIFVGIELKSDRDQLLLLAKQQNIKSSIEINGFCRDISAVYRSADLLVLPSGSGEGFPNVLVEAMASGLPCVVTDCGASRYIVGDCGWVAQPNDLTSLIDALREAEKEFRMNSTLFESRREMASIRARSAFSLTKMTKNYEKVWSGLLEK